MAKDDVRHNRTLSKGSQAKLAKKASDKAKKIPRSGTHKAKKK